MPKDKTDNFLKAIKKYAKAQKNEMQVEVKQLKTERLKEAEESGKRDSQRRIKEQLHELRTRRTAELAKQTQDGQKKLFIERAGMVDEVFRLAAEKLRAFTLTDAYTAELKKDTQAIAELFGDNDCVLYVRECDLGVAETLKSLFQGDVQLRTDDAITIGGVRGYCKAMAIIADETLDSRLEAQRGWLIENAALSVL